jgi:predicted nucleic acid-binding protein
VAVRLLLIDKSAYVRGAVTAEPEEDLCVCAVTRLELLYSARSESDYRALEEDLAQFRELRMDAETFAIALGAQSQLVASGQDRMPIPDLLIAACAQQHAADVVHVDRHYETLARVLAFTPVRAPTRAPAS